MLLRIISNQIIYILITFNLFCWFSVLKGWKCWHYLLMSFISCMVFLHVWNTKAALDILLDNSFFLRQISLGATWGCANDDRIFTSVWTISALSSVCVLPIQFSWFSFSFCPGSPFSACNSSWREFSRRIWEVLSYNRNMYLPQDLRENGVIENTAGLELLPWSAAHNE